MIYMVREFNEKFGLPNGINNNLLDDKKVADYRINFIKEELKEFEKAIAEGDRVAAFDALLDMSYVIHGTALFMGITPKMWCSGEDIVHIANLTKERASHSSESKRGTQLDVIKPDGWEAPEPKLNEVLNGK